MRRRAAPRMGRLLPLADLMSRLTGMRSFFLRRRFIIRVGPARQLWHPVSAMAVVARWCVSWGRV